MKVVKLNRRFKQFRDHGHVVALRFPELRPAIPYTKICREKLGGSEWDRYGQWCAYYGVRNGHSDVRPYWITFRNEADLTLVLLSANLTK